MDGPKTLLQMAGAPPEPAHLSAATLVIIDAQGEYRDGALPLDGVGHALGKIADLLARGRAAGTSIIHVAHRGAAGGVFDRQAPRGMFLPEAAPRTARL